MLQVNGILYKTMFLILKIVLVLLIIYTLKLSMLKTNISPEKNILVSTNETEITKISGLIFLLILDLIYMFGFMPGNNSIIVKNLLAINAIYFAILLISEKRK